MLSNSEISYLVGVLHSAPPRIIGGKRAETKLIHIFKNDSVWINLSGTDHQLFGKFVKRHAGIILNGASLKFSGTDNRGNGKYL